MSKRISRLLDEPENQVAKLITKLEDKNGYPSHDARLLAETVQRVRSKLEDLNLDPDDTTGEELYHALQVKFERDSRLFDEYYGAEKLTPDEKAAKAIKLVAPYAEAARQWGLKNKSAKDVLRRLPPKKLMKHLNYRSIESMLKREDMAEIYLALAYFESSSWLKSHKRLVSQLDQTAFEVRNLKLVVLGSKFLETQSRSNIIRNEEIAALGICPTASAVEAPLLSMVLLLADTLAGYTDTRASQTAARLNSIVAWWAGMDHLITELSGQPVSLNLKDCAANHLEANVFEERSLKHGREAFWRELISRYRNLPDIDGLFDETVRQKFAGLKFSGPEPAYEFVEDF